jgi:hypothetical protein
MIFKVIIIALLLVVIFSLAQALRFLIRDDATSSGKMLKSLTWRIGLSVLLFILLLIGQAVGWIHPHGLH